MNPFYKIVCPDWKTLSFLCLSAFLFLYSARAQEGDIIPKAYPESRYEAILKKSPFSLSSAAVETNDGITANLLLAGIVKVDGEYFVAILDKSTQKRELISAKANDQGLRLKNVVYSDDLDKVVVTLEKNGETAPLRYDMDFLKGGSTKNPGAPAQPGQMPNQPAPVPVPVTVTNAAPNNGQPAPPPTALPSRRRFVPSNPNQTIPPPRFGGMPDTPKNQ